MVRFVVGLALAVLLHAAGTVVAPGFPAYCDLFLITTVVAARHGRIERALVAGSIAGWAADALAGAPFGLFGFTNAAVGLMTAIAARRLVVERAISLLGLFAAASAVQGALLVLLSLIVAPGVDLPGPVALIVRVAVAAVAGPLWIVVVAALGARWRRWRQRAGGLGFSKSLRS